MTPTFAKPGLFSLDLPGVCNVLLAIGLGALVGYWALQLLYPSRPVAVIAQQTGVSASGALREAARPFESTAQPRSASLSLDVRLLGTVALGEGGRAVLLYEGKQITLGAGEEISPGVVLAEVAPTFVEFSSGGATRRVELAEPAAKRGKGANR